MRTAANWSQMRVGQRRRWGRSTTPVAPPSNLAGTWLVGCDFSKVLKKESVASYGKMGSFDVWMIGGVRLCDWISCYIQREWEMIS